MQRWEIKRLFVPTDVTTRGYSENRLNGRVFEPGWGDEFKKSWAEAEKLASEGWEMVGIAQEIRGNEEWWVPFPPSVAYGTGCSWTSGYILIFKRPLDA